MCTIFTMYSSFMVRVSAPAATWLLSLMFALSEPEHKSENKSKIDLGELRDCKQHPPDRGGALELSIFQSAALHISSFCFSQRFWCLLHFRLLVKLQFGKSFTPVCPNFSQFLEIWSFHRVFSHTASLRECLQRLPVCCRNFARALLTALDWKFHFRTGNSMCSSSKITLNCS